MARGNVRELEQAIRRIILTGDSPMQMNQPESNQMIHVYDSESKPMSAQQLMHQYGYHLYDKHHTYEAVAKMTELDRRTVKSIYRRCRQIKHNRIFDTVLTSGLTWGFLYLRKVS